MATAILDWPAGAPECAQAWQEQAQPVVVRSEMDSGAPKVRRRFTAPVRLVTVQFDVPLPVARLLRDFHDVDTQGGVLPFRFRSPVTGAVEVFRMTEAPNVQPRDEVGALVSMKWESLPYWGPA